AAAVAEHLLGTRDADAVTWARYEPAERWYSEYDRHDDAGAVRRNHEDEASIVGFAPGFTSPDLERRTGPGELERLAGGPVRRWHVYDYTIAAVTAAGAQPVDLPARRRQR